MTNLFKIICYAHKAGDIIVYLEDNIYIDNEVELSEKDFKKYLDRHEKLYYEHAFVQGGDIVTKNITLTLDDYFESTPLQIIHQDIYDCLLVTKMDVSKATANALKSIQDILNHFKL
jgi:hypothetical protein